MTETQQAELLEFFKALSDASRLKILGVLAQQERAVGELAEILDLSYSTVSNHLAYLANLGLVSARTDGHYHIYRFESEALHAMTVRLLSTEALAATVAHLDLDAYDRKVIEDYMGADGRLTHLPTKFKKLQAVLHYAIRAFEPGRRYSEKEVNDLLKQTHDDFARLRRELVEARILARERDGRLYWLVE